MGREGEGDDDGLGFTDPADDGTMRTGPVHVSHSRGKRLIGGRRGDERVKRGKEPVLEGGEVALHRKGPERDLLRCLRSSGESRSRKSQ